MVSDMGILLQAAILTGQALRLALCPLCQVTLTRTLCLVSLASYP